MKKADLANQVTKVRRQGGSRVVAIRPPIVKTLNLDDPNVFVLQEPTPDGNLLLKVLRPK